MRRSEGHVGSRLPRHVWRSGWLVVLIVELKTLCTMSLDTAKWTFSLISFHNSSFMSLRVIVSGWILISLLIGVVRLAIRIISRMCRRSVCWDRINNGGDGDGEKCGFSIEQCCGLIAGQLWTFNHQGFLQVCILSDLRDQPAYRVRWADQISLWCPGKNHR